MLSNTFPIRFLLLVLFTAVTLFGCGNDSARNPSEDPSNSWQIEFTEAELGVPVYYTTIGTVVSDQRIEVSSKLTGYINKIYVHEGDKVEKGQLLVLIDSEEVNSAIRQASAAVATAAAVYNDAEIDLKRYEALFDRGSISENEIRKMRLKFETVSESLKQAKAGLSSALSIKNYAELRSTVDGVVISKIKQPGDMAVPGAPILTLEVKEGFIIETFVAESRIADIHVNDPVSVGIDGIDKKINGSVRSIVNVADPVTRSCLVKIALPDVDGLRLGMFSRISFSTGMSDTVQIPKQSLTERGGLRGVFVIDENNIIKFRWLRTGREFENSVEITSGLAADERIVVSADKEMRDGDSVSFGAVR